MTLWVVFALMTAVAVLAMLWPLGRGRRPETSGSDLAVYQDQLAEIERDRAANRIADREAEAARIEVSRRLLAAADTVSAEARESPAPAAWRRRAAAVAALVLFPLGAIGLYLVLGSPGLPGEPLAARLQVPAEQRSLASLVTQVEAHLARSPEDGRGWEVLAPVYMRLGRFEEAVTARRNALRLLGATAAREADLGEALAAQANGIITDAAKASFERALALDGNDVRARFFIGLAAEQDGRGTEAAAIWRDLIAKAPAGAPWVAFVQRSLARLEGAVSAPPGPSEQDMAAAGELTPQQRDDMVRGMVERLAERLKRDGSDIDGWLRLVRAYAVLGERDKARAAASDARRALAPEPDKVRRLDELVKGLGLEG
jgi:cytochrome c-type biogenesis protein CcmH